MLFFILKYCLICFGIWFLWGLRNWIRKPWGIYISHTKISDGSCFVKVKHYSMWPPWLPYITTWYKPENYKFWHEEKSGKCASRNPVQYDGREMYLNFMIMAAESRTKEINDIIGDKKE